jgi:putative spermidine/putrescine transport system permease protein
VGLTTGNHPAGERRLTTSSVALARKGASRLATPWLLLPALILLGWIFAYPVFEIVKRSFFEPGFSFDNYTVFFDAESVYRTVVIRTLLIGGLITGLCLLLGYPYAYLMTVVRPRWQVVMIFVVLVPFWTSLLVRSYAWIILLQNNGVVNDGLAALGLGRIELLRNLTGVVIGMTQILLPFMVLPLYATMRNIDGSMVRAASSLGARPHVAFFRVYFPLSLPGVAAGAVLVFVLSLGFYITPALLGSPQQALASQLIVSLVQQNLDFSGGGGVAVVVLVFTFLILFVATRVVRIGAIVGGGAEGR